MRPAQLDEFLARLVTWARRGDAPVVAIGLAGSHARGTATRDSDVDIVVLVADGDERDALIARNDWVAAFGFVASIHSEDWGVVQVLRVFYDDGVEAEIGLAPRSWASTDPVDPGTRRVVVGGFRVVWDPAGVLADLVRTVRG